MVRPDCSTAARSGLSPTEAARMEARALLRVTGEMQRLTENMGALGQAAGEAVRHMIVARLDARLVKWRSQYPLYTCVVLDFVCERQPCNRTCDRTWDRRELSTADLRAEVWWHVVSDHGRSPDVADLLTEQIMEGP
jgi:hypothetical protein